MAGKTEEEGGSSFKEPALPASFLPQLRVLCYVSRNTPLKQNGEIH